MPVRIDDPLYNQKRIPDYMKKVKKLENGCWEWKGHINPTGYGVGSYKRKIMGIHRLFYILFVSEIPKGLVIDHLCRKKNCVNPNHLEAVTQNENLARCGWGGKNWQSQKIKCPRGHEYTLIQEKNQKTHRICKICQKWRQGKIKNKISLADFEEKLRIEEKLKNKETESNKITPEIVLQLKTRFNEQPLKQAVKVKLAQKNIICFPKPTCYAMKTIERMKLPIEELAVQLGIEISKTKLFVR